MYSKDGERYSILDGHTHRYEGFLKCSYDHHANLSPAAYPWPLAHVERYPAEDMIHAESLIAALDCIFAAQAIIDAAPRSRR
ncbi:MAG: uncharacterized protein QOE51_115 [Actinoplanes sp.]|nr:uncharacterized protein [Actinoplanes sp.]